MIGPGALVLAASVAAPDAATPVQAPPTGSPAETPDATEAIGTPETLGARENLPPGAQLPVVVLPPGQAPRRPLRWLVVEVGGGAHYQRIFSVQAFGGGGFVRMGSGSEANDWTVGFEYARGQTLHGLDVTTWRVGWAWDWTFDRFRIGLGPNIGVTRVDRATADPPMQQPFLGLDVHASFDILPVQSRSAFFVRASVNVDAAVWGPTLWLGFRFGPEATGSGSRSQREPSSPLSRQHWTLPPPGKR